jgi:hypothetical protein
MRVLAFALVLAVGSATPAAATNLDVATATWQQQEIDLEIAPVKSHADLQRHLKVATDSPLRKLPPRQRKAFIDSLVFTPKGLGSYSWLPLQGTLGMSDAYRVLALFGMQSDAASIPGMAPKTEAEHHMVEIAPMIRHDWNHKTCVIFSEHRRVCEEQYGAACSRACD